MNTKRILLSFVIALGTLWGCQSNVEPTPQLTLEQQYQNAIKDAIIADPSEISNNLIAITESNTKLSWKAAPSGEKRVLVSFWTKFTSSFPVGDTVKNNWGIVWVTTYPEIQDWFKKNYPTDGNVVQRAEQLLGLPTQRGYTHFVEAWVKPEDLFRPSADREITDTKAEINLPANVDEEYKKWYNDNIISSYYPMAYPWTRLGYTYDWGNPKNEIGLSEFIIKKNSSMVVKSVTPTANYLTK